MKLSIITVCFNAEKTIRRCVSSVLEVKNVDYEYLIVDGKSTDSTVEIAEQFVPMFQKKGVPYQIISEKDSGIYNAMNKAIERSNGDWIIYLNSDDYFFSPNSLNLFMNDDTCDLYDVIYGDVMVLSDGKVSLQKPRDIERLKSGTEMPFCHQSTFTKKAALLKYPFDERYQIIADIDSYLRMYEAGLKFKYIPECISVFSNDGVSQTHRIESIIEGKKLLKSHKCYTLTRVFDLNIHLIWYRVKKVIELQSCFHRKLKDASNI